MNTKDNVNIRKIKYGILSTAQIGRNCHVPAAKKTTNSEIVAISSRNLENAQKWAKELEIPKAYGSYDELLQDSEIDVVLNPLPNSMHYEWTIKAAKAGKHVLCEKPFSMNTEEAKLMIDSCRENNVLVMEAFTHRFREESKFVRELIRSGTIGEVKTIYADLLYPLEDWKTDSRVKEELGGGSLYDAGCYCTSLMRFLLDSDPLKVQAFEKIRMPNNVDSTFTGSLLFPKDILGTFLTSQEGALSFVCEVIGQKGKIRIDNFFVGNTINYSVNGKEYKRTFEDKDRFALQMEHFSDCVQNGKAPAFTPEDAKMNIALLYSLKKAARSGKTENVISDFVEGGDKNVTKI